jgi:hypothetical protein
MTTSLVEQIEEMRVRMHEQSRSELELVSALGSALRRTDETLLEALRSIAVEHELRRENIMHELQAFAARLGMPPMYQVAGGSAQGARLKSGNHEVGRPSNPRGGYGQEASELPAGPSHWGITPRMPRKVLPLESGIAAE